MALAPDGSVWFAEMEAVKVGRLSRDAHAVEFDVRGGPPFRIVVDASGEAWFTQMADHGSGDHAHHGIQSGVGLLTGRPGASSCPKAGRRRLRSMRTAKSGRRCSCRLIQ
ncbi:hypothetical protein MASR1M60_32270 [Rhodocyclaceae bacterium]